MNRALAGDYGFMRAVDRRGREILAAYRPVGYAGWGLAAQMDVQEAYAPVNRLRGLLLAIGGLILAAGLGASYLIARQNTRPIRRLAATADTIAKGNLDARIDITSNDEIGVLGQAFTRMTEQLARSHADLENRIAERTRDLEATRDLLDAFFRIFTSRLEPENIHRTFDTVLRFCHQLGYDVAMISLVDREAGVIRAVRGAGTMAEVVDLTVRPLDGRRHPGRRGAPGPAGRHRRLRGRPPMRSRRPFPCRKFMARSSCHWLATRCWARSRWPLPRSSIPHASIFVPWKPWPATPPALSTG